MKKVSILDL